jgi:hypothetical protein
MFYEMDYQRTSQKDRIKLWGADNGGFELAPQPDGRWAISAGLSYNYKDHREMLSTGMKIYDALYSWAKYAQEEKYTWSPK